MGRDSVTDKPSSSPEVSTHAPAWGATLGHQGLHTQARVSTHAPAWGATVIIDTNDGSIKFQPTRPHGARHQTARAASTKYLFQPTRPHGARPLTKLECLGDHVSFNPRARMGRDNHRKSGLNNY